LADGQRRASVGSLTLTLGLRSLLPSTDSSPAANGSKTAISNSAV
jgi:hypothetical protein